MVGELRVRGVLAFDGARRVGRIAIEVIAQIFSLELERTLPDEKIKAEADERVRVAIVEGPVRRRRPRLEGVERARLPLEGAAPPALLAVVVVHVPGRARTSHAFDGVEAVEEAVRQRHLVGERVAAAEGQHALGPDAGLAVPRRHHRHADEGAFGEVVLRVVVVEVVAAERDEDRAEERREGVGDVEGHLGLLERDLARHLVGDAAVLDLELEPEVDAARDLGIAREDEPPQVEVGVLVRRRPEGEGEVAPPPDAGDPPLLADDRVGRRPLRQVRVHGSVDLVRGEPSDVGIRAAVRVEVAPQALHGLGLPRQRLLQASDPLIRVGLSRRGRAGHSPCQGEPQREHSDHPAAHTSSRSGAATRDKY